MSEPHVKEGNRESTATLLKDISHELTDLVHEEVQLAQAELTQKAKRAGAGASLLAGAGGLGAFAAAAFIASGIAAMAQVMSVWLAALIGGAALAAIAGMAALLARGQLVRGTPLAPRQAIDDTKEEVEWLKSQARSARK